MFNARVLDFLDNNDDLSQNDRVLFHFLDSKMEMIRRSSVQTVPDSADLRDPFGALARGSIVKTVVRMT